MRKLILNGLMVLSFAVSVLIFYFTESIWARVATTLSSKDSILFDIIRIVPFLVIFLCVSFFILRTIGRGYIDE